MLCSLSMMWHHHVLILARWQKGRKGSRREAPIYFKGRGWELHLQFTFTFSFLTEGRLRIIAFILSGFVPELSFHFWKMRRSGIGRHTKQFLWLLSFWCPLSLLVSLPALVCKADVAHFLCTIPCYVEDKRALQLLISSLSLLVLIMKNARKRFELSNDTRLGEPLCFLAGFL